MVICEPVAVQKLSGNVCSKGEFSKAYQIVEIKVRDCYNVSQSSFEVFAATQSEIGDQYVVAETCREQPLPEHDNRSGLNFGPTSILSR